MEMFRRKADIALQSDAITIIPISLGICKSGTIAESGSVDEGRGRKKKESEGGR